MSLEAVIRTKTVEEFYFRFLLSEYQEKTIAKMKKSKALLAVFTVDKNTLIRLLKTSGLVLLANS